MLLFVETSREFGRGLLHGMRGIRGCMVPGGCTAGPALDSSLPEWKSLKIDGAIVRDVKVVERLAQFGHPCDFRPA